PGRPRMVYQGRRSLASACLLPFLGRSSIGSERSHSSGAADLVADRLPIPVDAFAHDAVATVLELEHCTHTRPERMVAEPAGHRAQEPELGDHGAARAVQRDEFVALIRHT